MAHGCQCRRIRPVIVAAKLKDDVEWVQVQTDISHTVSGAARDGNLPEPRIFSRTSSSGVKAPLWRISCIGAGQKGCDHMPFMLRLLVGTSAH